MEGRRPNEKEDFKRMTWPDYVPSQLPLGLSSALWGRAQVRLFLTIRDPGNLDLNMLGWRGIYLFRY